MIFKILIDFNFNMGLEFFPDNETKERYKEMKYELDFFKEKFLEERQDERVLRDPSPEYERLDNEISRLLSLPSTDEIVTLVGTKQQELTILRFNELNEKQPFGPSY